MSELHRLATADEVVEGQHITNVRTLGSWNDNDCVLVTDDKGNTYRMPCSTIIQMVNEFYFLKEKKIKHTYLSKALTYEG